MGTRNLSLCRHNGEYKIAQYGQWDGYPSGQGVTTLNFCKVYGNLTKLKENLSKIRFFTDEESKEIDEKLAKLPEEERDKLWNSGLWCRDICAEIFEEVANIEQTGKDTRLVNSIGFVKELCGFGCEWAYCINFDTNKLEVYKGYNTIPLTHEDEFYSYGYSYTLEYSGKKTTYYPIRKIKEYDLNDLPDENTFCSECTQPEKMTMMRLEQPSSVSFEDIFTEGVF